MDFRFASMPDGVIEISFDEELEFFAHALNDSVSSRAPRGSARPGLSTYWIDRVEAAARLAADGGSSEPFASGNATYLRLDGEQVIAAFDFDNEELDAQLIPLEAFLRGLGEWRQRVIDASGTSGADAQAMARNSDIVMLPSSGDD